jgi:hypothetical protein
MRKKELVASVAALKEQIESVEVQAEIAESAFLRKLAQEEKDGGWTALDKSTTMRNRDWTAVEKNLKDAYSAWCVNPLAKSYCDYMRYFVIGKGTQITTEDGDEALARIELFCEVNKWDALEKQICEELSRDGEVFVRYHDKTKDELDASVGAISLIDPLEIRIIDSPEVGEPNRYRRKYTRVSETDEEGRQTVTQEAEWINADLIEHIKVNTSHNELRGRSDLLVVLPWLAQLKRWIDDMSRRNYYIGAFNWDVECQPPITPSTIKAKYPTGPSPGTVIAHSPNEKWEVKAPDLHWADSTTGARALKLLIMAGYKMPESWFGDTGESNLATTKALAMPTLRAFIDRQDMLKGYFERVISRGARVEQVDVAFPEIVAEEATEKANALKALSEAFTNLQGDGLLSKESAFEILSQFVDTLDAWDKDESGPGEKARIEKEDQEEAVATSQGRSSKGASGLLFNPLARTGEPGMPPIEVAAGTAPQGL